MVDCETWLRKPPLLTDLRPLKHEPAEVVGVVRSTEELSDILGDLLVLGFGPGQFSALSIGVPRGLPPDANGAMLGAWDGTARPEAPFCVVRIGGCEAIVAEGSRLAFAIAAVLLAGLDAGLDDLIAHAVDPRQHEVIAALVDGGGVLLWATCRTDARRYETIEMLLRHGAHCVHQVARRA